ncbi:RHS repeat-associated core domain-containing protein [Chryseobacterium sp. SIMBA_028]|uniref:RHS repeat-associated core domain-containing protein n=2 Tax=Pseudomonadati TaxID=3379134 RepID=UPI00397C96F3
MVDANDYYPFGMNHLKTGNAFFGVGSYKNYKYNGKELQETGMYAMDFRHYMPDIGRFTGMDRLSDIMPDWTPYRFAFNNPSYFSDPTGLFEKGGNALATCPTCPNTKEFQPYINDPNKVYVYNPETNPAEREIQIEEVVVTGKAKQQNTNYHDWSQTLRKSSGYAFSANKILFQPAFERASQYGIPKIYTTTTLTYEKALPKILGGRRIIYQPLMAMNALKAGRIAKGLKVTGRVLGVAGVGLAAYDISQNGVNISNSLDITMSVLALTPSGVGQGIAATYFIANGLSVWFTGQDIGQHIQGAIDDYNTGVVNERQQKYDNAVGGN